MPSFKRSIASGSADLAWYCVLFGALALFGSLLLVGPHTAISSTGLSYNPFPEMVARLYKGLVVTGQIVLVALAGSIALGILIGVGRVSRFYVCNLLSSTYVEIIRGIPLLVILFMIYYGLNQYLPQGYKLSAFWSAALGLCICYGAFMGEAVRAGIEAIPPEELEAASLEVGRWQVLLHVTLPRALRTILPAGAKRMHRTSQGLVPDFHTCHQRVDPVGTGVRGGKVPLFLRPTQWSH